MPARTVKLRTPRTQRTTGLLMALAFVLIATGVTLYVALGHRPRGKAGAIIGEQPIDIGQPPDELQSGLGASKDGRFQFADRRDQTRLQAELAFATLDPLGGGYYKLDKPRAWVYLRDGRVLHIQAQSGRFKMPGRSQQPESGDLTGGVLTRLFLPRGPINALAPSPATPIDVDRDTPALMIYTPSATFDATMLELLTDETVTCSWHGGLFEGQGLLVRMNEVRERLEVVKTSGKFVRLNPNTKSWQARGASAPTPAAANSPIASAPVATGPADAHTQSTPGETPTLTAGGNSPFVGPPMPPREALYRCLITDSVTLTQRGRVLNADTLELFARTLDNQLPAGAIAPVALFEEPATPAGPAASTQAAAAASTPTPAATPAGGGVSTPEPTAQAEPSVLDTAIATPGVPSLFAPSADDVVLTWTGPLVLTPQPSETPPAQLLNGNDFAAKFSTERPGGLNYMRLSDPLTSAVAICSSIEYAATTRWLSVMSGAGVDSVSVFAPDIGRAIVPGFRVNLGTGVAQVPGGGLLAALRGLPVGLEPTMPTTPDAGANPRLADLPSSYARQIIWSDQADFQLRTVEGKLTAALQSAWFAGNVLARDHTSSLGGDSVRAEFATSGMSTSLLSRLHIKGNVLGVAGSKTVDPAQMPPLDPYLQADELDVAFKPVAGTQEVEPTYALAKGNAVAATRDSQVRAAEIDARIGRLPSGEVGVTDVSAKGRASFERSDGVYAEADTIRADPVKRSADLAAAAGASPVIVGRGASKIEAPRVRLDDAAGTLIAQGAGRFTHTQLDTASTQPTKVLASWSKGMIYDDIRGQIDCDGDASFASTSLTNVQKASAEQIRINITPGSGAERTAEVAGSVVGQRRVLRAEAIGSIVSKDAGKNARVESYRYASPIASAADSYTQGPREQVLFIEGPRIVFDDTSGSGAGVFSSPAAGTAIIRDERAADAAANPVTPQPAGGFAQLGATRGTSRLTWSGSMSFDRATGQLSMTKDVELAHLAPGAQQATRLVASTLNAVFGTGGDGGSELVRATASGAVYAELGPKNAQQRMTTDHFAYDAKLGKAEAWADAQNRVTYYPANMPSPVVAKRMLWDLTSDRVEITEPAPMTGGR